MLSDIQSKLTAAVCLCLGLLPSVHITALNTATLLILAAVLLDWRKITVRLQLSWPHWLLLTFILYSIFNTLVYESLSGNREHFYWVALETWSITLVAFFSTVFFSHERALKPALISWLPIGLVFSFFIMSAFFFSGVEGHRPDAFSTSALYPPMWFLILTGVSFCWFDTMSNVQKLFRFVLLGLAGVMTIYAGARLILIAWVLMSIYLLYFTTANYSKLSGPRRFALTLLGVCIALIITSGLDILFNGAWALTYRFTGFLQATIQQDTDFLRLQLWAESWRWITQQPWLGYGQINERLLLSDVGSDDRWYRAHQTYLSFWLGGGVIGLFFGLLFQLSALALVWPHFTRALAPAAISLLGVTILNGMTDSIFQSFITLQIYMLLVLLLVPHHKT